MDTVKNQFVSSRPDGRFTSSMAAHMEMLRREKPKLSLPENLTKENFPQWNAAVREKLRELLLLPEFTPQPSPVLLSSVQREGYRVDKWEFYPDDYTAVPFLALIPDGASAEHPVPGVICLPGSFSVCPLTDTLPARTALRISLRVPYPSCARRLSRRSLTGFRPVTLS